MARRLGPVALGVTPAAPLPLRPLGVAAVLLYSPRPARLVAFYRDLVGLALQPVAVPGYPRHHACEVAGVYLAVLRGRGGPSRTCLALMVDDVAGATAALRRAGVRVVAPPRRTELGLIARFLDPDGNPLELYQP